MKPKPSTRTSKEKLVLETLLELTQLLTDSRPLEESLRAVSDAALRIVPAHHASIRLLDATHAPDVASAQARIVKV